MRPLLRIFALLVLGISTDAARAESTLSLSAEADSGIEITAIRWLDMVPPLGYMPLTVTIRNKTGSDGEWTLQSNSTSGWNNRNARHHLATTLPVPERSTHIFPVLLPLAASPETRSSNCSVALGGPGIGSTGGTANFSSYANNPSEFFGMSDSLAQNSWTPLETKIKSSSGGGGEIFGSKLNPSSAPRDWRGYTGLADLWITDNEWLALEPPVRSAMSDWVATGGRVYLFQNSTAPRKTPEQLRIQDRHGFGRFVLTSWDGHQLNESVAADLVKSPDNAWASLLAGKYDAHWELSKLVGRFAPSGGFVLVVAFIFAIVAGPLNLFWFASAGRRHRLFWTTPLITAIATLIIGVYSIVRDGFGGSGARMVAAFVLPGDHQMAIVQEQVSKTGILLGSDFPTSEDYLMVPLQLDSGGATSLQVDEAAAHRSGWFASRSVQAQLLKTVRSTRGGLEVAWNQGAAPTVTSSLEANLETVFVQNEAGAFFTASALGTGEKKPLTPATENDFRSWWAVSCAPAGAVMKRSLDAAAAQRSTFFATVRDPEKLAIPTLASIRWRHQVGLCTGQITVASHE